MNKVYRMPNGRLYRFSNGEVPAGAVPVEKATPVETAKPVEPKAKKPANKARKAATK